MAEFMMLLMVAMNCLDIDGDGSLIISAAKNLLDPITTVLEGAFIKRTDLLRLLHLFPSVVARHAIGRK